MPKRLIAVAPWQLGGNAYHFCIVSSNLVNLNPELVEKDFSNALRSYHLRLVEKQVFIYV
jgi:hypothetical protein